MGTVTETDKAAISNHFLSLLGFQSGINLRPLSDNKNLFDMENIVMLPGSQKDTFMDSFQLTCILFPLFSSLN